MRAVVKAITSTLVIGMAVTGLSACSSGGSSSDAKTLNLEVASYSDSTKAEWQSIISGFEKKNPGIKVKLDVESWDNISDKVKTQIQGGKQPDILNIDAFSGYAKDGLLYKTSEVTSAATRNNIQTGFYNETKVDGASVALPLIASTRLLAVNKDLATQAGITEMPKTWDELLAMAKAIKEKTGDIGYGLPLGSEEAQAEFGSWLFGAGGSYGTNSKITVNTSQGLEAAKEIQTFINAGVTEDNPGSTNRTPLLNQFLSGKIGSMIILPPFYKQALEKNLNVELTPIPTKTGKATTLGVADHMMAFKNKTDKTASIKKFLDYFYSDPVYTKWVSSEGFIPVTKTASKDTTFTNDKVLGNFMTVLDSAKFYPNANPKWTSASNAIKSNIGLLGQGKSPQSVLKTIQSKIDSGN